MRTGGSGMEHIESQLPAKGRDIIGIDEDGVTHMCYRCTCWKQDCLDWKSSDNGKSIFSKIVKWEYVKDAMNYRY